MSEYYFPSLLYIKENLKNVFDSIYKDIDFKYDFIVYNETKRISKSKDETQEVPLNAAIQNLKGLVSYELKDSPSAIKCFDEALKLYPEFETAKANKASIEALEKK